MKVDFLNELVESRMFKHLRDFSRYNNRELAELSYICLLITVIHRRNSFIKEYIMSIIAHPAGDANSRRLSQRPNPQPSS